jgi:hypothetical protein
MLRDMIDSGGASAALIIYHTAAAAAAQCNVVYGWGVGRFPYESCCIQIKSLYMKAKLLKFLR